MLARCSPLAQVGAALMLSVAPLVTLRPVTPTIVLLVTLVAVPFTGLTYRALVRRAWILLLSVAGVVVVQVLFGTTRTGHVLFWHVTTDGAVVAGALALRVLAIALPGFVVFAAMDPTDLADALIQRLHAPPRFALGALAALRLLPLLTAEWQTLRLARRARGVDAGRNPVAHVRLFASTAFGLLVGAIRRGTRLAVAMEARGLTNGPRTAARASPFDWRDTTLIAAAALLAVAAVVAGR